MPESRDLDTAGYGRQLPQPLGAFSDPIQMGSAGMEDQQAERAVRAVIGFEGEVPRDDDPLGLQELPAGLLGWLDSAACDAPAGWDALDVLPTFGGIVDGNIELDMLVDAGCNEMPGGD